MHKGTTTEDSVVQDLLHFLDTNNDGTVSFIELMRGLEHMGQRYHEVPDLSTPQSFIQSFAKLRLAAQQQTVEAIIERTEPTVKAVSTSGTVTTKSTPDNSAEFIASAVRRTNAASGPLRLSDEQHGALRNIFASVDVNGDGSVGVDEIAKIMNRDVKDTTVTELMKYLDRDGNGSVSFVEMVRGLEVFAQHYGVLPSLDDVSSFATSVQEAMGKECQAEEVAEVERRAKEEEEARKAKEAEAADAERKVEEARKEKEEEEERNAKEEEEVAEPHAPTTSSHLTMELQQLVKQLYDIIDCDHDDNVTADDITTAAHVKNNHHSVNEFMDVADTNKDGAISFTDMLKGLEQVEETFYKMPEVTSPEQFVGTLDVIFPGGTPAPAHASVEADVRPFPFHFRCKWRGDTCETFSLYPTGAKHT
eukprot:TRINITY_DN547_c0_g1_i2.p1 TRINITY_DN547_c0_g1~~TRINITY_DN547_c0_g1_i2.p1  ORF type:complete len:481 (+),score=137.88 TRINITY_DN547_c0_g1_i2:185-1444(+)